MTNEVTDANGGLHINGKASVRGIMCSEAWLYDDLRQVWVLGQSRSEISNMLVTFNELTIDSQTKTSQQVILNKQRMNVSTLDLDTGQTVTVDVLVIEHLMFKLNDGEVQFQKSWDIVHD